jgi:hypothetical protein
MKTKDAQLGQLVWSCRYKNAYATLITQGTVVIGREDPFDVVPIAAFVEGESRPLERDRSPLRDWSETSDEAIGAVIQASRCL